MKLTAAILFLAATAFADERTVPVVNPATPQSMQEMATILRTVIDIGKVNMNSAPASLTIQGTTDQLAAADWIIRQLDRPAGWKPSESERAIPASREFRLAPAPRIGNILRVFYVSDTSVQGIQEELTILRTVLDTAKVFQFAPLHALVYRERQAEADDVEWLLQQLEDHTTSSPYKLLGGHPSDMLRVFALPADITAPQVNRIVRELRLPPSSIAKIFQRITPPTIAVRGTDAQLDQADKLIAGSASSAITSERTLTLLNPPPAKAMEEMATVLRTVVQMREVNVGPEPGSIKLRGTPADLDAAEWIVHSLDKPAGWQPTEAEKKDPSTREFRLPASTDRFGTVIRIFYLSSPAPKTMEEEFDIVRWVLHTQPVSHYAPRDALVYRDGGMVDPADIEWLLQALEAGTTSSPHLLAGKNKDSETLRVFALPAGTTAEQVQTVTKDLRIKLTMPGILGRTVPPAIAVSATPAQLEQVAQLIVTKGNQ